MATSSAMLGSLAPDFDLPSTGPPGHDRQRARLVDYRGRWLILIFYPRDFSLVCPTELVALSARAEEFRRHGAELLGVSTDTLDSHRRWVETPKSQGGLGGLNFPLASDEYGEVSRAYGVFLEWQGVALRGLFIIDPNGVLQYQVVHNLSVGRRSDEVLRVLNALQTGGLCGEGWSPEEETIDLAESLGPGSVIGRYRIERALGSGSFSTVFRAFDRTLRRPVALKVLRRDSPISALDEARAAAALSHPNVCTVFNIETDEGAAMIAMEYLEGRPLQERIARGPLDPEEAREVVRQVARGMAAAHEAGIVHGDLKPANVMLTDSGLVKILDFGLSRRDPRSVDPEATADLDLSGSGGLFGTPSYMAPEQAEAGRQPGPASDVFALAAIAYETLTGRKAFPGANILEVLARVRSVEPGALADDVSEPFRSILGRALARDPGARTITMSEIADTLTPRGGVQEA